MSAKRSSAPSRPPRAAARLRDRRRQGRRRLVALGAVAALALLALADYGLWQPGVRIEHIAVSGAEGLLPGPALTDLAASALSGAYLGLIPRDSAFFYSAHRIRAAVAAAHPEVAALSISREGLTGLTLAVRSHTAVGRWCGAAYLLPSASSSPPGDGPYCYLFDPDGVIYAALAEPATSSPSISAEEPLNSFALYAPLADNAQDPLRATIAGASALPGVFAFARSLASLGSAPQAVAVRGDEADIYLASGTRITYVVGQEQAAFSALASAKADLNLADGSLDYVDLRFSGKVYLKKRGE